MSTYTSLNRYTALSPLPSASHSLQGVGTPQVHPPSLLAHLSPQPDYLSPQTRSLVAQARHLVPQAHRLCPQACLLVTHARRLVPLVRPLSRQARLLFPLVRPLSQMNRPLPSRGHPPAPRLHLQSTPVPLLLRTSTLPREVLWPSLRPRSLARSLALVLGASQYPRYL